MPLNFFAVKYILNFCFVCCLAYFLVTWSDAFGQNTFKFSLNDRNGLPSNHVYDMMVDCHGYLWICTNRGIVQYNGYHLKTYSTEDGLTTSDVWELFEDTKGRIWLGCNSEELGYIANGRYHGSVMKNITGEVLPQSMQAYENGIFFFSPFINKTLRPTLCLERNDAISMLEIPKDLFLRKFIELDAFHRPHEIMYANKSGEIGFMYLDSIYKVQLDVSRKVVSFHATKKVSLTKFYIKQFYKRNLCIRNYVIFFRSQPKFDTLSILNSKTGEATEFSVHDYVKNENIQHVYSNKVDSLNDKFYVITDNHILKFVVGDTIRFSGIVDVNTLGVQHSLPGSEIKTYYPHSNWGTFVGTTNSGANIVTHEENRFKRETQIDLANFRYSEGIADKICFWWNKSKCMLGTMDSTFRMKQKEYPNFESIRAIDKLIPIRKDTFLAIGLNMDGSYFYTQQNRSFTKSTIYSTIYSTWGAIINIKQNSSGRYYVVDTRAYSQYDVKGNTGSFSAIDAGKYFDLVHDSLHDAYWCYNAFKISVHSPRGDSVIDRSKLLQFGINRVEKIQIESNYGNVFIKGSNLDENSLTAYSTATGHTRKLFERYNLSDATINLYHNLIVVCGRFGVLFCKIEGPMKFSSPIVYDNIKDINYSRITDVQISWGKVLLNTDQGAFSVHVPGDSAFSNVDSTASNNYKIIYIYRDTTHSFKRGDTLRLNQNDYRVQLDLINPTGTGKLGFKYQMPGDDSSWHTLNSNELSVPPTLTPGHYYKCHVKAYDDVWKSDAIEFTIFIIPSWWQILFQNPFFWIFIGSSIVVLIAASIYFTQKAVNRKNIQKNLRQEMEIKSVHSQINPHFIFNSLNTALYYIKKGKATDAYDHVARFSHLLRGYIKSSRSKYITIADEIVNLENYIRLQLNRFENKFKYEIVVDDNVSPSQTKIPALLMQPIVENAIDHGLFHMLSPGHLRIEFKLIPSTNEIQCIVDDDGIGRKQSKAISANSIVKAESYGDSLIKDLVEIFNRYEKSGISIQYIDKQPPLAGTTVIVHIKNPPHYK